MMTFSTIKIGISIELASGIWCLVGRYVVPENYSRDDFRRLASVKVREYCSTYCERYGDDLLLKVANVDVWRNDDRSLLYRFSRK